MDTKAEIISLGFSGESRTIFAEDIGRLMFIPAGNTGEAASELPGSHTQSATAPVDPLDGDTWYKPDTEQMFFRINATWCAIPFTTDPDGVFNVSMELADVTGTIPGYGVLGRVGLSPTIGDGATPGGIPIGGSGGGGSQLTLITDAAAAVKGYNLTEIPDNWQRNVATVKSVSIGNIVTTIGNGAFDGCTGLTGRVIIPDSVTRIKNYAFQGCPGITGELVLPATYITPAAVDSEIGTYITPDIAQFAECTGITSLQILGAWPSIPASMFAQCSGLTGSIVIPPTVIYICDSAFAECVGLTGALIIPEGVTYIGSSAFALCSGITSISLPSTLATLKEGALGGLGGITSITLPSSITEFGDASLYGCTLLTTINSYISKTLFDAAPDGITDSGVTTIHARASDATWTAGAGQTIGGKSGITVIKDL